MSLPQAGVQLVATGGDAALAQIGQFNSAVATIGQTATQQQAPVSAFGQIATGALRAVGEVAVSAFAAAGSAVVDFVASSKDAATAYTRTMSDIVGLTSDSAAQVAKLSDAVLKLAPEVGKGPQELADALYFVASSGIAADQQLEVLTESAKAAAAGLGETKQVADLVTSVMNAYGASNISAAEATDILTTAVKDGKGEPDQYAAALGRVLPIAAAAGVSFQEVAASISTMTLTGLSAAEAVTALRGIIGSLEKPGNQTRDALASIGLSADDVRASIRDRGLLATLQDLYTRTNGNLDVLGRLIPNVRALTGVLSTTASQGEKYAQVLADMKNSAGATDAAFKQATQTMDFQSKALTAALESLQIELGQALLPGAIAATKGLVAFAESLQGKVGPAVREVLGVIGSVVGIIQTGAIPAITGVTVALTAYAIVQTAQALPAILEMIPAIAAQTAAFFASAEAILVAIAPYALIAAAVAGVVYAYQNFTSKVDDATSALLNSRQWWLDSTAAIEDYSHSVGAARDALTPYAATIRELRSEIQGEIDDLGRRMAAGLVTDAQYQQEMAHINQQREGLIQVTAAYNDQEQALLHTAAASMTGTAQLQALTQGEAGLFEQTRLTEKELADLDKQIQKTFDEGAKAVGSYVDTEIGFLNTLAAQHDSHTAKMLSLQQERDAAKTASQQMEIDKRIAAERQAYATEEQNQALSYAKQQAAQRAHLGQMLEDYTLEQVKLGNITGETADKILASIEQSFGQVSDVSARTFLGMTRDIDSAAKSGGSALDSLSGDLSKTADAAVDTKAKMDALAKQYTAQFVNDFEKGRIDAHQLADALKSIPSRVETEIVTRHTDVYSGPKSAGESAYTGQASGRAVGGPVLAGMGAYLVGETGPELFVPRQDGTIITAGDTQRALTSTSAPSRSTDSMVIYAQQVMVQAPASMASYGTPATQGGPTTNNDFNLQVLTNQSPAVVQQGFHVMKALATW